MYGFGQAWSEVAEHQGISQIEAGRMVSVSNSHVSKIMNGQRKAPKDVMRTAAIRHDDPRLHFATIHENTGGAFPEWLNNVNLEPAAVAMKTVEELEEAIRAIRAAPWHKKPGTLTPEEEQRMDRVLEEGREATCSLLHLKGVVCIEHKRSWSKNWYGHNDEMEAKNYLIRK